MPFELVENTQSNFQPVRETEISSYEPSFYETNVKPMLQKLGFIQTREQRVAHAMNVYSEAKQKALSVTDDPQKAAEVTKQLIPVIRDNWDDYVEQEYGLYTPARANKKMEQIMVTAGLSSAGLANPVQAVVGIGTFMGLKGIAGATVYPAIQYFTNKMQNMPYYYHFVNSPEELLPEDASEAAKGAVELAELIGLGGISAGISRKYPAMWEAMTKETITKYNMPKEVYISPEKVKSIYQTGEKISPQEMDLYNSLGLTGEQVKTALRQGVNVKVPMEKVVTTVDKPYFAKIKEIFRAQPFEQVQATPAGKPTTSPKGAIGFEPYKFSPMTSPEGKTFYHGGKIGDILEAKPGIYGKYALYGEGLYLTDNPEIAASYMKVKGGKQGKVVAGQIKNANLIDLEKKLPDDAYEIIKQAIESLGEDAPPNTTGTKVWDELNGIMSDIESDYGQTIETYQFISEDLSRLGYDGFQHIGGEKIGGFGKHNVAIIFPQNIQKVFKPTPIEPGKVGLPGPEKAAQPTVQAEAQQTEQKPDVVKKVIEALKGAKSVRGQQEKLYKKARGEKLAKMMSVGGKTSGEAGFYSEKGALKGELPKAEFESIRGAFKQEEIDELFNMVKDSPHISPWDKITAREGLANLFGETGGKVPTKSELKMLHKVFGAEFTEALLAKRDLMEKIKEAGYQVVNVPRAIMSSFDLSFGLRQGSFAAPRYRQEFFDSWKKQFRWFKSDKAYLETMKIISENPNYELAVESGVSFTEMDSIMTEREELFASQWAEKIPVVGRGVRASARAYTAFANKFRMDIFDSMVQDAEALGLDPQSNADLTKQIADLVNSATGRGDLGQFERAALALNAFFFSPRLMASRVGLLTKLLQPSFYTTQTPYVRKEYLKILLTWLGTGMTIATLAKMAGADVGIDSRSSDFGKIKIGPTRIDVWGGFQQYVRMAAQLISGEYISSTTGKKLTLGEGYKPLTRLDILYHQLEGKEAPIFSLATRMLKGQDITGKKVSFTKELALRFVPMVIQDLYDVIKENPKAVWTSILSPFGVGVQTYSDKKRLK